MSTHTFYLLFQCQYCKDKCGLTGLLCVFLPNVATQSQKQKAKARGHSSLLGGSIICCSGGCESVPSSQAGSEWDLEDTAGQGWGKLGGLCFLFSCPLRTHCLFVASWEAYSEIMTESLLMLILTALNSTRNTKCTRFEFVLPFWPPPGDLLG